MGEDEPGQHAAAFQAADIVILPVDAAVDAALAGFLRCLGQAGPAPHDGVAVLVEELVRPILRRS